MNYDQNDCQQFSFIIPLFPTLANTLKTKVGDVVGCIFEAECNVGGFLILKHYTYMYSPFFNQRTTTPQFTPKIELTTLYTFDIGS
jgi:hypothetical protein